MINQKTPPVILYAAYLTPDEEEGVLPGHTVQMGWLNNSGRDFSKIQFELIPLNSIGEVVACRCNSLYAGKIGFDGIMPAGWQKLVSYPTMWVSKEIVQFIVASIRITYTDGSTEKLLTPAAAADGKCATFALSEDFMEFAPGSSGAQTPVRLWRKTRGFISRLFRR